MTHSRPSTLPVSQLPPSTRTSLKRGEVVRVTSRGSTVATISPGESSSAQERLLSLAGVLRYEGRLDAEAIDRALATIGEE